MKTGTRTQVPETRRSGMPRILRDSLRSFCSSSVSPRPSSTIEPASGSTLKAMVRANLTGSGNATAEPSYASSRALSPATATWSASSSTPATPAAGDRLVGRRDQADQPGLVVQRLEHRHRGHRGAVRVGDDPLARLGDGVRVDLGDHQRHVGVHPEGRGVVDHDGPGRGERRRERPRGGRSGGEQRDVEAAGVGGGGVLDDDLAVAARQHGAGRPGGGEEPDLVGREVALQQDLAHHDADLAGGADDADPQAHRPVPP